ncbi:MAG: ferrochelatase [Gammaproteobacteria bacterium]
MKKIKTGVVLANIGTPEHPTVQSVRKYLKEFLSDPRVVKVPKLLWWFILRLLILPFRPKRSAHAYQTIWTEEGSQLLVITKKQQASLQAVLGDDYVVKIGMCYGNPSMRVAIKELVQSECDNIILLPLYPQYCGATTAAAFDLVANIFKTMQFFPQFSMVNSYYDHPKYIEALNHSIKNFWNEQGKDFHLLFSFHGIPEAFVKAGDPYAAQCKSTAKLLADSLELKEEAWSLAFQSRLGNQPWLQPYCDQWLASLPKKGIRRVAVLCPGFAADCLETLEEMAMQNREIFLNAGGESFHYIPALNASPLHIELLKELVS